MADFIEIDEGENRRYLNLDYVREAVFTPESGLLAIVTDEGHMLRVEGPAAQALLEKLRNRAI